MNDAGNMFGQICLAVLKGEINAKWLNDKYPGPKVIFWWTPGPWSACSSRTGSASSRAWCGPQAHSTGSRRQPSWILWLGWRGGLWSAPLSVAHSPVPAQTSCLLLCFSSCRSQEWYCRLSESRHGWESCRKFEIYTKSVKDYVYLREGLENSINSFRPLGGYPGNTTPPGLLFLVNNEF